MTTQPLTDSEKAQKERALATDRFCYVPVITATGASLGVALEGISGFCPTDYHSVPSWSAAVEWADQCNEKLGRSKEDVTAISISSTRRRETGDHAP